MPRSATEQEQLVETPAQAAVVTGAPPAPWLRLWERERPRWAGTVDRALLGAAGLLLLFFLAVLYRHSGAIWRDEASTLFVAKAQDWASFRSGLSKDTSPVLIHALLRLWIALGPGASESGLRLFGILVFAALCVSLIASCRTLSGRTPLIALSLVSFNAAVLYYGSSLRSYGLALALIIPCYAAFWRLSQKPTRWNALACLLLATLSCHASYLNAVLLLGIGTGAAAVCALNRSWKACLLGLTICFVVALSMLPYVPVVREYEAACKVVKSTVSLGAIVGSVTRTISGGKPALLACWTAVVACGFAGLVAQVLRQRRAVLTAPSLPLYLLITSVVTGAAGLVFFLGHDVLTFAWHYTPFLVLAGLMVEVSFAAPRARLGPWLGTVAACCALIVLNVPSVWSIVHKRRTNVDLVCQTVAENAGPNDCVLVSPFWLAASFKYHYRGKPEWNTIPLTSSEVETSMFPYLAIERVMQTPGGIEPTLRKIEQTLSSGNRVWIAGALEFVAADAQPLVLPPAPHPRYGWHCGAYNRSWSTQAAYYLQNHAGRARAVSVPVDGPVHPLETASLIVFEGWRAR